MDVHHMRAGGGEVSPIMDMVYFRIVPWGGDFQHANREIPGVFARHRESRRIGTAFFSVRLQLAAPHVHNNNESARYKRILGLGAVSGVSRAFTNLGRNLLQEVCDFVFSDILGGI